MIPLSRQSWCRSHLFGSYLTGPYPAINGAAATAPGSGENTQPRHVVAAGEPGAASSAGRCSDVALDRAGLLPGRDDGAARRRCHAAARGDGR